MAKLFMVVEKGDQMIFSVVTEQEKLLPIYIKGIGIQDTQEYTDRKNGYFDYQWTLCAQGRGKFVIGGKEYIIEEGMGFFFSPYIPHMYYSIEEPWITQWITFNGSSVSTLLHVYGMNAWEVFIPKRLDRSKNMFDQMYRVLEEESVNRLTDASSILYRLLSEMKKDEKLTTKQTGVRNRAEKLKPVIHFMENNYANDLSLDILCALIQVTPHYLCKLFKQSFGISPVHYLIRIRLQTAKQLLIQCPEFNIQTIARQVGYQDISYFCSIFRAQEQMTPSEFRKIHGII